MGAELIGMGPMNLPPAIEAPFREHPDQGTRQAPDVRAASHP